MGSRGRRDHGRHAHPEVSAGPATVLIRGGGVSVATAHRLLRCEAFEMAGAGEFVPPPAPVIMLSESALGLLRDIFERPTLFCDKVAVERRIVAWGDGQPAILPHSAIILSGAELSVELAMPALAIAPDDEIFFTLHGVSPFPDESRRFFGHRTAMAASIDLCPRADERACHVEAVASGWLFLIPCGPRKAWLLGVGDTLDVLLAQSRLVSAQVDAVGPVAARFETAPRMLDALAGPDWLACGTAAVAFDPICGDGTAQSARAALLAAAVIAGIRESGGDDRARTALLGHYRSMLLAAMRRHLQISLPFYRSGGTSPWWREQAAAAAEGYDWCTAQLARMPEPAFVLRGTRLVRREPAA